MKFTLAAALLSLASAAPTAVTKRATDATPPNGYGANFKFPLANGFPSPNAKAIAQIENLAGGSLPEGPAPPNPGTGGALDLSVIATNEIFEVAFFTELLHNITNNVAGYSVDSASYDYVVSSIQAIKNQEELHALAANSVLAAYNYSTIAPCRYTFPVTTYADAIALAATFTDIVLGALQSVEADLATGGNAPLASLLGSIIAQEGEQVGWYRYSQAKVPSSAPFLTNTNGIFAYNALNQLFIVPGSCPANSALAQIPVLGALNVVTAPAAKDSTASFSVTGTVDTSMYVTWMSGQNLPLSVPVKNVKTAGGMTTFDASFPYASANFARGLTVAAVTTNMTYADNTAVAMGSKFGPGIIEIN